MIVVIIASMSSLVNVQDQTGIVVRNEPVFEIMVFFVKCKAGHSVSSVAFDTWSVPYMSVCDKGKL